MLCAVSVDLDEVPCYSAIHGLPALDGEAQHAVYRAALPRLEALFDELSLQATFFAVGRDLDDPMAREAIARLVASGHEIGNHSQDHLYDLTRRPKAEIAAQVRLAAQAIERAVGAAPVGFRAPGYTVTDAVFEVLQGLGVRYDSSVFPCPAYYALKTAAISWYRLSTRPTHSIVDHPRVLRAPAQPYRVGTPYTEPGSGLLELPIGVTRDATGRLPYIGTYLALAGPRGARMLTRLVSGRPFVNLELHGIDAADAQRDGLQPLVAHQPDLRRTSDAKLQALRAALVTLRRHGYTFVTLAQAAQAFAA